MRDEEEDGCGLRAVAGGRLLGDARIDEDGFQGVGLGEVGLDSRVRGNDGGFGGIPSPWPSPWEGEGGKQIPLVPLFQRGRPAKGGSSPRPCGFPLSRE